MADSVEIRPIWSIDYRVCSRCGATTVVTTHHATESKIEVDPLPHPNGYIEVDYRTGRSQVIPLKHMKNHPELWMPHIATCSGRSDASQS